MKTDEFRKLAEEIVNPYRPWHIIVDDVEEAIRNTHNRAVDECADVAELYKCDGDDDAIGVQRHIKFKIRRLRME